MRKPGWVTTVGILGIILGGMGLLGSIQALSFNSLMAAQQQMLRTMGSRSDTEPGAQVATFFADLLSGVPAWFGKWMVGAGLAGLVVFGAYLLASVRLFRVRPGAVPGFCWISAVVIAYSCAQGVAGYLAFGRLGAVFALMTLVSTAIYVALLSVAIASDKSAFRSTPPPLPPAGGRF
jgi:hypothetical protein